MHNRDPALSNEAPWCAYPGESRPAAYRGIVVRCLAVPSRLGMLRLARREIGDDDAP